MFRKRQRKLSVFNGDDFGGDTDGDLLGRTTVNGQADGRVNILQLVDGETFVF